MVKQDILNALAAKFAAVLQVKKSDELAGVAWYVANILDVSGDTAIRQNVSFYVVDEGEPTEAAYWQSGEPKPAPGPTPFQAELAAWLDTLVAADTILFYSIVGTVPNVERARVNVVLEETGTYVERKFGVYKDDLGDFQYVMII